nr:rhamnogalacturonan acetylesterase [uncultured Carboxylicivirga sp.]
MNLKSLIFLPLLLLIVSCEQEKPVNLLIAGDSTAQSYDTTKTLMRGWAQMLPDFLDSTITVKNHAKAGRSTKSFIEEERWDKLIEDTQAGDYVIIQFGHNDASNRPERHASYPEYRQNLVKMINDVQAKQANPILATSIVMRTFNGKALIDDRLLGYPVITRQIADSLHLPLLDIYSRSRDMVIMLGDEPSKELYMWFGPGLDSLRPDGSQDDTHLREAGATAIAELAAKEIKKLNLKNLSSHVVLPE